MDHYNHQHGALESMYVGLCEVLGPGGADSRLISLQLEMRPEGRAYCSLGKCLWQGIVGEGNGDGRARSQRSIGNH